MPPMIRFNPADRNQDGRVTAAERAGVAWSFFKYLLALGISGYFLVLTLQNKNSIEVLFPIALIVTGSGVLAALLGLVPLTYRHVVFYIWEWREVSRQRQWAEEDRQAALGFKAENPSGNRISQAVIDNAVRVILKQYFARKGVTRDAMVAARLMTAPVWNEASAALAAVRMRTGKNPPKYWGDTFEEAWAEYLKRSSKKQNARIGDDGTLIKTI